MPLKLMAVATSKWSAVHYYQICPWIFSVDMRLTTISLMQSTNFYGRLVDELYPWPTVAHTREKVEAFDR